MSKNREIKTGECEYCGGMGGCHKPECELLNHPEPQEQPDKQKEIDTLADRLSENHKKLTKQPDLSKCFGCGEKTVVGKLYTMDKQGRAWCPRCNVDEAEQPDHVTGSSKKVEPIAVGYCNGNVFNYYGVDNKDYVGDVYPQDTIDSLKSDIDSLQQRIKELDADRNKYLELYEVWFCKANKYKANIDEAVGLLREAEEKPSKKMDWEKVQTFITQIKERKADPESEEK